MAQPKTISVDLRLPGTDDIKGPWTVNEEEERAAWEIYVELVTRVPVVQLRTGEGLLGEALSSLYTLFDSTREILRKYGPSIGRPENTGGLSFAYLSISLLNEVLRPVLARYHPLLVDYESMRPNRVPPGEHERKWENYQELRHILNEQIGHALIQYADLFAEAASVPSMAARRSIG